MIVYEKKLDLATNTYDVIDQALISSRDFVRNFGLSEDYVEVHVYNISRSRLLYSDYNSKAYKIPPTLKGESETVTNYLEFSPGSFIESLGYIAGRYVVTYNVLRKKIVNASGKSFFIKQISPDRTELRVISNQISDAEVQSGVVNFIQEYQTSSYYKDYLLNFGDNKLVNAINIALDTNTTPFSVLVKLYKPLPDEFSEKSAFWFVEELSTAVSFEVEVSPDVFQIETPKLKSANFNIEVDYKANSLSEYYNKNQLLSNDSLFSYQQLVNKLYDQKIQINIDYTKYEEFVHFSSAARRLINFINKVKKIESYTDDLNIIKQTPYYTASFSTSQSAYKIQSDITDIITSFDGYENFLYYETSSKSWPKSGSVKPYTLYRSNTIEAVSWIGSLDYESDYYGGEIYSASYYDNENQNNLVYTIPEYIRVDETNEAFDRFVEMMGEYFDSIWVYIKSVTDLYKTSNKLNRGISKDLVYFALRSLGIKLYNSKANEDLYRYLIGSSVSGSYSPFSDGYSTYVSASSEIIPGQDIQKEVLKRIYHNIPSLLKKKGTVDGIDDLISIFGIPYTILSATQFGGADKTSQTVEYVYDRFSYAYYNTGSAYVKTSWDSLYSTAIPTFADFVPDTIEFRFKPDKRFYTQTSSLLEVVPNSSTNRSFGIIIRPDNSLGSPYSKVEFYLRGASAVYSSSVSLPIYYTDFTGDTLWWNVMLKRQNHTSGSATSANQVYTLTVANKIEDRIGHQASSSVQVNGATSASYNQSWSNTDQSLYLGGSNLTSDGNFLPTYKFIGSYQELRYWATPLSQSTFLYHVLSPESIRGNSSGSSYQDLSARYSLGNDLFTYNHSTITQVSSIHPNQSNRVFYSISVNQSASFNYDTGSSYKSNIETYVTDSPNSVYANPVNQKVRIVNNQITGSVLSHFLRLEDETSIYRTKDVHFTDVSFSPQNEINKDIISQYGSTIDIDQVIGDPRQSSLLSYPDLTKLNSEYYQKYKSKYNLKDYVRLIQFYDNALFKMILDYIPARDSVTTGLTIKSPILERSKAKSPQTSGDVIFNPTNSEITGSKIEADSIYISGVGDLRDFYTGELSGSEINVHQVFVTRNRNPYL